MPGKGRPGTYNMETHFGITRPHLGVLLHVLQTEPVPKILDLQHYPHLPRATSYTHPLCLYRMEYRKLLLELLRPLVRLLEQRPCGA